MQAITLTTHAIPLHTLIGKKTNIAKQAPAGGMSRHALFGIIIAWMPAAERNAEKIMMGSKIRDKKTVSDRAPLMGVAKA